MQEAEPRDLRGSASCITAQALRIVIEIKASEGPLRLVLPKKGRFRTISRGADLALVLRIVSAVPAVTGPAWLMKPLGGHDFERKFGSSSSN